MARIGCAEAASGRIVIPEGKFGRTQRETVSPDDKTRYQTTVVTVGSGILDILSIGRIEGLDCTLNAKFREDNRGTVDPHYFLVTFTGRIILDIYAVSGNLYYIRYLDLQCSHPQTKLARQFNPEVTA